MRASNPDKSPFDIADNIDELIFDMGFFPFYDYLETIVAFLESEREKHNQSIHEISEKIKLGEIESQDDSGQMPPALEYDYFRLERIAEFENTLFSSFFVTIYFYLDSELTRHCHDLVKAESRSAVIVRYSWEWRSTSSDLFGQSSSYRVFACEQPRVGKNPELQYSEKSHCS